ncbi:hypothetical protein SEVIR_5G184100v4 [Setaria viridis]|uniref:Uncharacterized protein n=1 Tax=Setaria viridis TaxID=4556 RepID=A0A4U6UIZ6_SETVI|nr:hypothetical protein SEVIR_5G184100v2 [Setaria viridis]
MTRYVAVGFTGCMFVLFCRLIDETKHHILKSAHPSGMSANRGLFGCRRRLPRSRLLEELEVPHEVHYLRSLTVKMKLC